MIKIAHFIYDSSENPWLGGGGYIRTVEIYKRFPGNYKIDLFCGDFYNSHQIPLNEQIHVKFIGRKSKCYLLSRLWYIIKVYKLLKFINNKYDLVIEDFSPYSPLFTFRFISKKKLICIVQNYFGFANHFKKFGPAGILPFIFEKTLLKKYDNYIFSSDDLKQIVYKNIRLSAVESESIPNGVSDEFLGTHKENVPKRGLLFAGRLEIYQKGIDTLLEQFSLLINKFPDLTLTIAGNGKDRLKVESLINKFNLQNNTTVKGRVDIYELKHLYSSSYITVIPSRYESWGMVSLESQACGTPVVASNIPGLRQTLQHQKSGFLFNNTDELISYISSLLNNSKMHEQMSHEARRFASGFTWKKQAVRTKKLMEKLIRG
jgi:glycosyltransferase involved in cell wall biosynthesis